MMQILRGSKLNRIPCLNPKILCLCSFTDVLQGLKQQFKKKLGTKAHVTPPALPIKTRRRKTSPSHPPPPLLPLHPHLLHPRSYFIHPIPSLDFGTPSPHGTTFTKTYLSLSKPVHRKSFLVGGYRGSQYGSISKDLLK